MSVLNLDVVLSVIAWEWVFDYSDTYFNMDFHKYLLFALFLS